MPSPDRQSGIACACRHGQSPTPLLPPANNSDAAKGLYCVHGVAAVLPVVTKTAHPQAHHAVECLLVPATPLEWCSTLCRFIL